MYFVADFETTTKEDDCRVWAWAVCEVGDTDNLWIGTDIYDFMDWCETRPDNVNVYFHNLKFDSQFIINWLFENEFRHVEKSEDRATRTFKTMISDKGLYYAIEVIFYRKGKNIKKVTFLDSAKLFPGMGVDDIARAFRMPIQKLKIDYSAHDDLPYEAPLTEEEKKYIINDVKIVANAIEIFQQQGMNKMTIASCAMAEYKKIIGERNFKRWFPVLNSAVHNDIKQSYKGGYTYVMPDVAGREVGNGVVADVNGLFSAVMMQEKLPHGTPILYRGKYEPDDLYPLYTQMIRCQFELKPGKIPTIQIKDSMYYSGNEYLTTSDDDEVVLCLNSPDLEIFLDHYEVYNLEYISGWKYKAARGFFDEYIEKWSRIKAEARAAENWGLYLLAKLMLNALYGKFGTSTTRKSKAPYLDSDGVVKYKDMAPEEKEGVYLPMASFITSFARQRMINALQRATDDYRSGRSNIRPCYCDTDSLHCISEDFTLPDWLEIDKSKLGAWKFESKFTRGKFLRQKCYIEMSSEDVYNPEPEYKLKVTVAGMPSECYEQVNFRNFKIGASYTGKKLPQRVKGGVILRSIDFTIKR